MAQLHNITESFLYRGLRKRSKVVRDYVDSAAVAAMTGLSVRMVCLLAERYEESGGTEGIPSYRPGKRKRLFDRVEVERWIQSRHAGHAIAAMPNKISNSRFG